MSTITQKDLFEELAERGWRTETITKLDGSTANIKVPLTEEGAGSREQGRNSKFLLLKMDTSPWIYLRKR